MLEVRHLYKSRNGNEVLHDVNAVIDKGEVVALIGPSGSGKSTFLRCLNRLEEPDGGRVLIDGEDILSQDADVPRLRRKMGMVFQQFHLFSHLTVLENIMLAPCKLLGVSRKEAWRNAFALLETVGLSARADAFPQELSGGQQQRVAIARALAMKPEILFFDEPVSALDPAMAHEVLSVIRTLAKSGIAMILVTHDLRFAREIATRVLFMDEGRIIEEGSVEAVLDHPQEPKTKAFLQRIGKTLFSLKKSEFDRYRFAGEADQFAEKQLLPAERRETLLRVLELLTEKVLFPRTDAIQLELEISAETRQVRIHVIYRGASEDPMASREPGTETFRKELAGLCSSIAFAPKEHPFMSGELVL